jgi:hypothetical protein
MRMTLQRLSSAKEALTVCSRGFLTVQASVESADRCAAGPKAGSICRSTGLSPFGARSNAASPDHCIRVAEPSLQLRERDISARSHHRIVAIRLDRFAPRPYRLFISMPA